MKRLLLPAAAVAAVLAPISAQALTITLDAETLRDAAGDLFPTTGLLVLTAATQGTFLGPTPTSFATGTEIEVSRWDLSAWSTPGAISDLVENLVFSGDWNEGDPLRLYWYPTLTIGATAPGEGTAFGSYTDLAGIDGSDAWLTPSEGAQLNLRFSTTDASELLSPGSLNPQLGWADEVVLEVIPEPGTAVFGLVALAAAMQRRRRS